MKKQEANLKKALESLWKEPTSDVYPKRYSTGGQILSTMASLIPGYGAIISPLISVADQFRDANIAKKEAEQTALNSRPTQMNTDIYGQMASGGYTTSKFKQYRTGGHMTGNDQLISENGVPSNNNAVAAVQNNENAYTNNKQTYIYSDVLVNPETGNPFNVDSAKAVKKYKYADTDPEQKRALDFTMNRLSMLNDTMRNMKQSVQKAFGGPLDPGNPYMPTVTNSPAGSMTTATVAPVAPVMMPRQTTNLLAVPYGELPTLTERGIRITPKYDGVYNTFGRPSYEDVMDNGYSKSKERFREKANGGLTSEDRGSDKKPYPSVSSNDFAGGNRSYPIPTKADAIDALRLAGLHGRNDVRAKVYDKYPDLKKDVGGGLSKMTNMATTSVADALAFQGKDKPDTPLQDALHDNNLYYRKIDFNKFSNQKRGWEMMFNPSTFPLVQPWTNALEVNVSDNAATTPTTQPAQPVANVATQPASLVATTNINTPVTQSNNSFVTQSNTAAAVPDSSNIGWYSSPEQNYGVPVLPTLSLPNTVKSSLPDRSVNVPSTVPASVNTPQERTPFNANAVAMGLKAVALGKSIADALEKPVVEKPMFTDYNAADRQMYGTNVDYTQARQDAMAASNLAANVNRAASTGFNQYQGRMQSTYGNLADQLGQISMNENLQRNQQAMQRGQYETAKAIDVKNTMYQNRIDNLQNTANAKLADEKLFSELSQIGSEFNKYQNYREMLQNNKELSQATINQGLALIGSNYANFGFTADFINKIKSGQASVNELVQFMAATDQAKQTKGK